MNADGWAVTVGVAAPGGVPVGPAAAPPVSVGDPDCRQELLYESPRTRVRRLWAPDGCSSWILKEALGPGSVERIRHEAGILDRLAGLPGVARTAGSPHPGAVLLADDGAIPLDRKLQAGSFSPDDLLTFAVQLGEVLAGVHSRGVVHRDLSCTNVLIDANRRPVVIDFELATTALEERPGFGHHRELLGTLAYMAPEQTGRTARPVDHRADLYAVGSLLYELATGLPPFYQDDDLRHLHELLVTVPPPLADCCPGLPQMLSAVVATLLQKEPDLRYQSAEGLVTDLARLRRDANASFPLREHDYPPRLAAPSTVVGRDPELAILAEAFQRALSGAQGCVLLAGAPGVGKSVLVEELRPLAARHGGWFVSGKAEQFRTDAALGPVLQAVRGIGRILLAEPEDQLESVRGCLAERLGTDAAVITQAIPEFEFLLDATDPGATDTSDTGSVDAGARLRGVVVELLRGLVSAQRPLVLFVDDLQWTDPSTLTMLDGLVAGDPLPGLLVVGAYRAADIDPAHPLTAMLQRWERTGCDATVLTLENLSEEDLGGLLAGMLRLPARRAAELASLVGAWSGGNPFDSVEIVNAMRRAGALRLGSDGWTWDAGALRHELGFGDVVGLLTERIGLLPDATRKLLHVTACLGGEVELGLLAAATGDDVPAVRETALPALEDGLLVLTAATGASLPAGDRISFRHDRVLQATMNHLGGSGRAALHLGLARRLGVTTEHTVVAAEQYLSCDPENLRAAPDDERRRVVDLYGIAAGAARRAGNHAVTERFAAAALDLWETLGSRNDSVASSLLTQLHAALYALGRLGEADQVYDGLLACRPDAVALSGPACVQMSSLSQRNMHQEARLVALAVLAELGVPVPDSEAGPQTNAPEGPLDALVAWASSLDLAADLARPELTDPRIVAVERLFSRLLPTAFFLGEPSLIAWIVMQSQRLWVEHGPSAGLAAALGSVAPVAIATRGDYRVGYLVGRHAMAVSEARNYEPETSVLRHRYAMMALPWAEPLENALAQARLAREGLLRGCDLQMANHTAHTILAASLDVSPSLEAHAAEVDDVLALAARAGHSHMAEVATAHLRLVRALQGRTGALGSFDDESFDEEQHLAAVAGNAVAVGIYHVVRALAAAVFDDLPRLEHHTSAAMEWRRFVPGYPAAVTFTLRGLSLAGQIRRDPDGAGQAQRAELDTVVEWLVARAADAPANLRHLALWIGAERAWATGDLPAAVADFDRACAAVAARARPWHQALIFERAAVVNAAADLAWASQRALIEARRCYEAWGATAKLIQLDAGHPGLAAAGQRFAVPIGRGTRQTTHRADASADPIDLLAVLRACEALSSQTQLADLQSVLVDQLSALTGATEVVIAVRDLHQDRWSVPVDGQEIPTDEAIQAGILPGTAFRYAERTRRPLLVDDATEDVRFAADPYLSGAERCSLLVVPVLRSGEPAAVLVLANRDGAGAFTGDRLDVVELITGQLAVSLANAQLYAQLEARVAERTQALETANRQLEMLSRTDPLTGLGNRRRFEESLQARWLAALQEETPLAVAMIDVDHFKSYNDTHGHLAGDDCLRRVAAAIEHSTRRDMDLACRYGGEEFVVVMRRADAEAAHSLAERVRAAVGALGIVHSGSSPGILTVSVGIATATPSGREMATDLLDRADANLYRAKQNGRNQTCGP